MSGLLDFLDTDDGRLGLGLLAAAGPRSDGMGFGGRIQEAFAGQDARQKAQAQAEWQKMQMEDARQQMAQRQKVAAQADYNQAAMRNAFSPMGGGAAMSNGQGPTLGNAENIDRMQSFDPRTFLAQNPNADISALKQAMELQQSMQKQGPKFSTAPQYDQQGNAFILAENGEMKYLSGVKARDKLNEVRLGDKVGFRTDYSPEIQGTLPIGQSPDSRASNSLGWANHGISRERMNFDKAGGAEAGKPQLVDGQWVYKPNAQNPQGMTVPVAGFTKALGEGQKKQLSGIESLNGAIEEYVSELGGWSKGKMLMPDARASMGTKYNNMMLQAKEAYNLGVLNGPDLKILTDVVSNPTDMSSALTSTAAMTKQATELRRIMGATAKAVRSGGSGAEASSGAEGSWGAPKGMALDALPTPNASNKGQRFRDTQTGKVLMSNGIQWKEAR